MKAIVIAMVGFVLCAEPAFSACGPFFGTESDREQNSCVVPPPPTDTRQLSVHPADPAAGVFIAVRKSPTLYEIAITAHELSTQPAIEKYLAYRAAQLTLDRGDDWFSFVQERAKNDSVALPKTDPTKHYNFRVVNFQPVWRYQTMTSAMWKRWSPFSNKPFLDGTDPANVTAYETRATIVLHKGTMPDTNPFAFDAHSLRDLLATQVQTPAATPATETAPKASSSAAP